MPQHPYREDSWDGPVDPDRKPFTPRQLDAILVDPSMARLSQGEPCLGAPPESEPEMNWLQAAALAVCLLCGLWLAIYWAGWWLWIGLRFVGVLPS